MEIRVFRISFIILFFINSQLSFAQETFDKLILVDKTSIECKVLRVTENSIEIDPKGSIPFQNIDRNKVDYIIYSDNTVVKMQINDMQPKEALDQSLIELNNNGIFKNCTGGVFFTNQMADFADPILHEWKKFNETNDKKIRLCKNVISVHSQVEFSFRQSGHLILNQKIIETSAIKVITTLTDQNETVIYTRSVTIPSKLVTYRNGASKGSLPNYIEMDIDNFELLGQKFILKLFFGNVTYVPKGSGVSSTVALKFGSEGWIDPETGY
jgi:hypothetical protein